jgi:hypothetical protein
MKQGLIEKCPNWKSAGGLVRHSDCSGCAGGLTVSLRVPKSLGIFLWVFLKIASRLHPKMLGTLGQNGSAKTISATALKPEAFTQAKKGTMRS